MDDAIRTERLTKYYGGRKVVDHLDLRIPEGTVYGLLGRNGAGKSTTLKMLTGMVRPDYGRIELLGEDVETLSPATRARIAYLAEGHPLYTDMTIRQAVAFTTSFYPNADRQFVGLILDHFALSPKAKIGRLSKGQRAQVSLALALAPDPELLILDDPTLGLDTNVRRDFLESMIQIIQRRGRSGRVPQGYLNPWDVYIFGRDGKIYHADLQARTVHVTERIVWPLFVLLLGLPGWIGYRFGRSWPVLEACPDCGVAVPRDRENCLRCTTDFPRPALKGTEMFA